MESSSQGAAAKLHPSLFPFVEFVLRQIVAGTLLEALPDVPEGTNPNGAVLIFLPGYTEIYECLKVLDRSLELHRPDAPLLMLPLHSLQLQ